ncbi:MAG: EamA family transporter [Actinomycetota bacterium]
MQYAVFLACGAIWGSTFLFISLGNDEVAPVWAAALRLGLASLILLAITLIRRERLPRGDAFKAAFLYGLLGFGINFPILYIAEQVVPSGITAVFYATIPISTAFYAKFFGLEPLQARKLLAALVAIVGLAFIFNSQLNANVPARYLIALIVSASMASLSGVLLKRGPRQSSIGANAVGTAVGFAIVTPISFILGEHHTLPSTFDAAFPIIYLTIAGSVGAYVLFGWLVNHWPVTTISFITVIIPVIALALGVFVRSETVGPASFIGAALVIAALFIVLKPHNEPVSN